MKKYSVLIFGLLTTFCFSTAAIAQIPTTIPGIIDKIRNAKKKDKAVEPKKEGESGAPQKSDSAAASNNTDSSSSSRDANTFGKPIPGAKLLFSNSPDGAAPKTTFTSSEYIYGRLDLGGRTMYDA